MSDKRRPTLKQIAAAAVAQAHGIPHEHVERMTTDQILSLIEVDHYPVPFSTARDLGWTPEQYNHPSNLMLRLISDHREKTNRVDKPQIAKSKRVSDAHKAFTSRILARSGTTEEPAPKTGKPKVAIKSRGFQKRPAGTKFNWRRGGRLERGGKDE